MRSAPGEYHGFLWFYFINEQLLRFLNMRYPRDYDTVPRLYFWRFHLLWLFPWSVYFPAVARLSFKPLDRAGKVRLLALCWAGFILVFFTFSTTQEYYSMPCYPALALLLGSAMAAGGNWIRYGTRVLCGIFVAATAAVLTLVLSGVESPGARRYFRRAEFESGRLQAFARAHGRSYDRLVRLSSASATGGRAGVSGGSGRHRSRRGAAGVPGNRADGGFVFSSRAHRHGGVRPLSIIAAAGGSFVARAGWKADRGSSLLLVFVGLLLHQCREPWRRSVAQRPLQQPGVRILRARRAGCVYRRRAMERADGWGRNATTWSSARNRPNDSTN